MKSLSVPEKLNSCVKFQGDTIFVLEDYTGTPLFLSFVDRVKKDNPGIQIKVKSVDANDIDKISGPAGGDVNDESSLDIVNRVKKIFQKAAGLKASDIHIVKYNNMHTDVFFRVNGLLIRDSQLVASDGDAVMRSLYQSITMTDVSYLDNEYQAAQFHRTDKVFELPDNVASVRIQRGPIFNGHYMALRILYTEESKKIAFMENTPYSITDGINMFRNYGYLEPQAVKLARAARQPQGMVIFSGPTGSGKSTALKVALEFQGLIYPEKAIYTIEDPPEYHIKGAKQLPVLNANTEGARSSKFAEALRVAMRSDPDILMVGEIRDEATAKTAMDAVITGHQMWTTVHALDTFAIFSRLLRFGVNLDDMLDNKIISVLVGQRLIPVLCGNCKVPYSKELVDSDLTAVLETFDDEIYLKNKKGCQKCAGTGISGRTVVAEVVSVTDELTETIKREGISAARKVWASSNITMIKHAEMLLTKGLVDPRAIIAYIGDIPNIK